MHVMKVWLIFFIIFFDTVMANDLCTGATSACSSDDIVTIGDMALCFVNVFCPFTQLVIGGAYVGGILMFISAVFKFKQYKDNSTQIPIGTAFALFGISVILIFLPGLYSQTGMTIFGDGAESACIYGTDLFNFGDENLSEAN